MINKIRKLFSKNKNLQVNSIINNFKIKKNSSLLDNLNLLTKIFDELKNYNYPDIIKDNYKFNDIIFNIKYFNYENINKRELITIFKVWFIMVKNKIDQNLFFKDTNLIKEKINKLIINKELNIDELIDVAKYNSLINFKLYNIYLNLNFIIENNELNKEKLINLLIIWNNTSLKNYSIKILLTNLISKIIKLEYHKDLKILLYIFKSNYYYYNGYFNKNMIKSMEIDFRKFSIKELSTLLSCFNYINLNKTLLKKIILELEYKNYKNFNDIYIILIEFYKIKNINKIDFEENIILENFLNNFNEIKNISLIKLIDLINKYKYFEILKYFVDICLFLPEQINLNCYDICKKYNWSNNEKIKESIINQNLSNLNKMKLKIIDNEFDFNEKYFIDILLKNYKYFLYLCDNFNYIEDVLLIILNEFKNITNQLTIKEKFRIYSIFLEHEEFVEKYKERLYELGFYFFNFNFNHFKLIRSKYFYEIILYILENNRNLTSNILLNIFRNNIILFDFINNYPELLLKLFEIIENNSNNIIINDGIEFLMFINKLKILNLNNNILSNFYENILTKEIKILNKNIIKNTYSHYIFNISKSKVVNIKLIDLIYDTLNIKFNINISFNELFVIIFILKNKNSKFYKELIMKEKEIIEFLKKNILKNNFYIIYYYYYNNQNFCKINKKLDLIKLINYLPEFKNNLLNEEVEQFIFENLENYSLKNFIDIFRKIKLKFKSSNGKLMNYIYLNTNNFNNFDWFEIIDILLENKIYDKLFFKLIKNEIKGEFIFKYINILNDLGFNKIVELNNEFLFKFKEKFNNNNLITILSNKILNSNNNQDLLYIYNELKEYIHYFEKDIKIKNKYHNIIYLITKEIENKYNLKNEISYFFGDYKNEYFFNYLIIKNKIIIIIENEETTGINLLIKKFFYLKFSEINDIIEIKIKSDNIKNNLCFNSKGDEKIKMEKLEKDNIQIIYENMPSIRERLENLENEKFTESIHEDLLSIKERLEIIEKIEIFDNKKLAQTIHDDILFIKERLEKIEKIKLELLYHVSLN